MLQSGPGATAAELAGRLSVDERTVRRYATYLCELGIAVRARRGRNGGFQITPGYRLPPLIFTNDEAVVLVLGLLAAGRAAVADGERYDLDAEVERSRLSALVKIRRVLPRTLIPRVDALVGDGEQLESPAVQQALPVGATRAIPASRGTAAAGGCGPGETAPQQEYRVDVTLDVSMAEARRRIPEGLATLSGADGAVTMRATTAAIDGVARVLAGLGWPFVIHGPQVLRDEVRGLALRLLASVD